MVRKKKANSLLISGVISALASLAIVAVAPGFAGPSEKASQTAPKDNDGDADSDPNTAYEDDHTTADEGDNAHPSGKDRSVENGGSGNQGKSESNPDDSKGPMRYEGAKGDDKPAGPGGTDLADQDGNNGCGNDDDFNDDNNGWCGKPRSSSTPPSKTCPNGSPMPANGGCGGGDNDSVQGNNKTCPNGSSMVQGKSCSLPDQDGRGPDRNESGTDKAEDGNNGCGNDVDGMDDNEGWCGQKPKDQEQQPGTAVLPSNQSQGCPDDTVMDAIGDCLEVDAAAALPGDEVLGAGLERDVDRAAPAEEGPSVLGIRLSPALNKPLKIAGAVLPFTGGDALMFVAIALALFACGMVAMRLTRKDAADHS